MVTEFAREQMARRGVKVVVPGEKERVVVSLSKENKETDKQAEPEEDGEMDKQAEEENGQPVVTAHVGEKCEVQESIQGVESALKRLLFLAYVFHIKL